LIQAFFPPALRTRLEKNNVLNSTSEGIRQSERPPALDAAANFLAILSFTLFSFHYKK